MGDIMSNRLASCYPTAQETQACAEAQCLFTEYLKLFPVSREAVELLERNLLKLALVAKMAASKPAENVIQTDAGVAWHRDVDLMDNIFLCHRPIDGGTEYAVMEHFNAHDTNEIWNCGWDAIQVLRIFANEQREALEFGTKDMVARITEFLAEKYSGQDLSHIANSFNHRFNEATSSKHTQSLGQNNRVVINRHDAWGEHPISVA
jgi:hypothetical protein